MTIITANLARANVQAYKESNISKFEEEHKITIENISKAIDEVSLSGLTKVELPFVLLEKNIQEFIDYLKHFGYDACFEQETGARGYNTCFSQEYGSVEKLINIGEIARRGYLIISWKDDTMKCRILKKLKEWFNGPVTLDKYVYMTKMEFGDMKRMYHNKRETHLVFREHYHDRWLVDFVDSDTRNEYGDKVVTVGWCGEYNGKKGIFYFNEEFTKRAKIIPEKEILCVE